MHSRDNGYLSRRPELKGDFMKQLIQFHKF